MTTILLARHGETDWNRDGRFQGYADPPLNDTGRAQVAGLAAELVAVELAAVYSSPLRRAFETAELLAGPHQLTPVAVEALREVNVGSWQGPTLEEVSRASRSSSPTGSTTARAGRTARATRRWRGALSRRCSTLRPRTTATGFWWLPTAAPFAPPLRSLMALRTPLRAVSAQRSAMSSSRIRGRERSAAATRLSPSLGRLHQLVQG